MSYKRTELQKELDAYNKRVRRLQQKNPNDIEYLPQTLKIKYVRDNNIDISELKQYGTSKGTQIIENKYGLKTTTTELKILTERINKRNAENKKRLEEMKNIREKTIKSKYGENVEDVVKLGNTNFKNFEPFNINFDKIKSKQDYQKLKMFVNNDFSNRDIQYQNNYLKTFKAQYNDGSEEFQKTYDKLASLPPDEFANISLSNDNTFLRFMYLPQDNKKGLEKLRNEWGIKE